MAIKAVIWDMGGVLLRTEDYAPRHALARRMNITPEALEHEVFSNDSGMRAQRGEIPVEEHWENIRQHFSLDAGGLITFRDDFFAGDQLDRELVGFLNSLRKKYKVGLLSNNFSDLRYLIQDVWDISGAFDDMIISAEVGLLKPDPEIFLLSAERLEVRPEEAVFLDDFLHNVAGARSVGMHAIHFKSAAQARSDLATLYCVTK